MTRWKVCQLVGVIDDATLGGSGVLAPPLSIAMIWGKARRVLHISCNATQAYCTFAYIIYYISLASSSQNPYAFGSGSVLVDAPRS